MSLTSFTPLTGTIGGALIGSAAVTLLWMNGDILGISGILSTAWGKPTEAIKSISSHWKLVFLGSFAITSNMYAMYFADASLGHDRSTFLQPSYFAYIFAGFLVGLGTKLGNGCTSGHGVCGLARLSKRSLAAVLSFLGSGIATAVLLSPDAQWANQTAIFRSGEAAIVPAKLLGSGVTAIAVLLSMIRYVGVDDKNTAEDIKVCQRKSIGSAMSGVLMALGLAVSGMTQPSKVLGFLNVSALIGFGGKSYDPTLMTVLGAAVLVSWSGYQFVDGYGCKIVTEPNNTLKTPLCAKCWTIPSNTVVDAKLILGSTIFGIGWGVVGLCPGPALYQASQGVIQVVIAWMPAFFVGSYIGNEAKYLMDHWTTTKKNV